MIRRRPRSTEGSSSAAADVYKRQALTGPGAPVAFQVAVNATGEFELQDAGDQPIPHLRPTIAATLDGIAQVVQRLVHLSLIHISEPTRPY